MVINFSNKNELGIAEIFKKHNEEIYRYLLVRVRTKEIAQDLTSDVFVKFLTTSGFDEKKSSVRTWLFLIARGILINYIKKESLRNHADMSDIEETVSLESTESINSVDLEFLLTKIKELDEEECTVLTLKYVNNLQNKEIAKIINCSYSNTKVKIHRAINKLKEISNGNN